MAGAIRHSFFAFMLGMICFLHVADASLSRHADTHPIHRRVADLMRRTTEAPAASVPWSLYKKSPSQVVPTVAFDKRTKKLQYTKADNGDRLPDFSKAGYHRSDEALPAPASIPNKITLSPTSADATSKIQQALDRIADMPADERGIRGALLLKKGKWTVKGPLTVKSGVIVRGEGSSIHGTVIHDASPTASSPSYMGTFYVQGHWQTPYGTPIKITEEVPVGARSIRVSSTAQLKVGQTIMVRGKVTKAWLSSVGNGQVPIDRPDSWQPGMQLNQLFQRVIIRIDRSTIQVDAPIFVRMGTSDMPADLLPIKSIQATEVGFENLRAIAKDNGHFDSTAHATNFISFGSSKDCWVRNIITEVYPTAVLHDYTSTDITVQDSACLMPKAPIQGGNRYAFPIRGTGMLYQRLYAFQARHSFDIAGQATSGPNVYLDCYTNFTYDGGDTHNPYSSGSLWDNVEDRRIFILRRVGVWSGMNCVIWNSDCINIDMEMPGNKKWWVWSIGNKGVINGQYGLAAKSLPGLIQAAQTHVQPRSLFIQQLIERRGRTAAASITSQAQLSQSYKASEAMPAAQFWPVLTPGDPPKAGVVGP